MSHVQQNVRLRKKSRKERRVKSENGAGECSNRRRTKRFKKGDSRKRREQKRAIE